MTDWENMRNFAIEIILHSLQHRLEAFPDEKDEIVNQRIIIMHLDHSTELLMKAYLLRMGESIDTRNGETISFKKALNKVTGLVGLNVTEKELIWEFHELRNNIQHKALDIQLNKDEKIEDFAPALYEFYKKMFPQDLEKIEGMLIEPQL